jgi:phage terminase small subunit
MPVLPNQRHEAFAQALAKGKSATEAMTAAGYRTDRGNASRLTANDSIRSRVAELQAKVAKKVEVTVESLADELEAARSGAMGEKQFSAAVSASLGKAKLFGLGSETRKLTGTLQVVTITTKHLESLNDDELAALEAAYPILEKLGIVGSAAAAARAHCPRR